jgi:hypothetical protein
MQENKIRLMIPLIKQVSRQKSIAIPIGMAERNSESEKGD